MARAHYFSLTLLFSGLVLSLSADIAFSATFTLVNQCTYTVWPGLLSSSGSQPLSTTGFSLNPGDSFPISVPTSWSGRIWGRTLCSEDSTGKFTCATADCGSGAVECGGSGAVPPATLAEFTLNGAGGLDFYDVSLVDGYNLPMLVVPHGGSGGNCSNTGCLSDLNESCPTELKVVNSVSTSSGGGGGGECVACKSACEAFGDPKYCCSGAYATPDTCGPSSYSEVFKSACPWAYSYAYDDKTSTFTCASADYIISFCPTPSASKKSSGGEIAGPGSVSLVSSGGAHLSYTPLNVTGTLIVTLTAILQLWRRHH